MESKRAELEAGIQKWRSGGRRQERNTLVLLAAILATLLLLMRLASRF